MKAMANIKFFLLALIVPVLAGFVSSCDNDDNDGAPVIMQVRTTDPEKTDSTFVQGTPGQMIVIEGRNLGSVKEIYINNQKISFNGNYVTPTSIIVTIPANLKLTAYDPELPKEIRVVTSGGTATYSFHVLAAAPSIVRTKMDFPVNTGDPITVFGMNFFEMDKIVMEGENGTDVQVNDFTWIVRPTADDETSTISFNLPAGVEDMGQIVVYCAAGEAAVPYALSVQPPVVKSFSSDMPVVGSEFFITGENFISVTGVRINNEIDVPKDDFRVCETQDTIFLKLPAAPSAAGPIAVTAAGGIGESAPNFYPVDNLILNFDNVGAFSWGADANLYEGDGNNPPFVTTGKCCGLNKSNVGNNWWFGAINAMVAYPNTIPDATPTSDITVCYEVYMTYPFGTITHSLQIGGTENMKGGIVPVSAITGQPEYGKWIPVEMPLSDICISATYGELKANNTFYLVSVNPSSDVTPIYEFYIDNIRLRKNK